MKKTLLLFFIFISFHSYGQTPFTLADFYTNNPDLDKKVDEVFNSLDEEAQIAQMIIGSAGELGKPEAVVKKLVQGNKIGGLIFLKGEKATHTAFVNELNSIAKQNNQLPLLYSIDAEPSLLKTRIKGSNPVPETIDIKTEQACDSVTQIINQELHDIGIQHNYAPVIDISPNNAAIKKRSFGDRATTLALSKTFIKTSQANQIVATAKHFPGHGLVQGDTHKQSVYIDGDMQELDMYPPMIDAGVLTIMVAHITVQNNPLYDTKGLPSTCSRNIVTDLLKDQLGFEGIVITDALNMMKAISVVKDGPLLASKAGCDLLLMPIDEIGTLNAIKNEIQKDEAYKKQVHESVKKILRLKICLGMI